jgi:DNA-binding transcriptional regulator YiaG
MTATQFRQVLDELGLSQRGFAAWLGVNEKTARDWADTRREGPPAPVAKLLLLMLAKGLSPDQVDAAIRARAADRP